MGKGFDINDRNLESRNFGLGSRDMSWALSNAYNSLNNAYATNSKAESVFNGFRDHLKASGIHDLRNVTKEDIASFKDALLENGRSASTVQDYISAINQGMQVARLDDKLYVSASKDLGVEKRSAIATMDKSTSQEQHNYNKSIVDTKLAAQMGLQRELGLRFKESCLINPRAALKEAKASGRVTITDGTKGGRARVVPANARQIAALERAAAVQGSDRSMIPAEQSYKDYRREAYSHGITYHGERHHYANERYQELSGCQSPVRAGIDHQHRYAYIASRLGVSIKEAKEIDHAARMQVAQELGHGRTEITNNYLG